MWRVIACRRTPSRKARRDVGLEGLDRLEGVGDRRRLAEQLRSTASRISGS